MLGNNGFGVVLSAIWTAILTSFVVVIAVIMFCLGGWKLSEIIWGKIRNKFNLKRA
jgi:hypothetical protein